MILVGGFGKKKISYIESILEFCGTIAIGFA